MVDFYSLNGSLPHHQGDSPLRHANILPAGSNYSRMATRLLHQCDFALKEAREFDRQDGEKWEQAFSSKLERVRALAGNEQLQAYGQLRADVSIRRQRLELYQSNCEVAYGAVAEYFEVINAEDGRAVAIANNPSKGVEALSPLVTSLFLGGLNHPNPNRYPLQSSALLSRVSVMENLARLLNNRQEEAEVDGIVLGAVDLIAQDIMQAHNHFCAEIARTKNVEEKIEVDRMLGHMDRSAYERYLSRKLPGCEIIFAVRQNGEFQRSLFNAVGPIAPVSFASFPHIVDRVYTQADHRINQDGLKIRGQSYDVLIQTSNCNPSTDVICLALKQYDYRHSFTKDEHARFKWFASAVGALVHHEGVGVFNKL